MHFSGRGGPSVIPALAGTGVWQPRVAGARVGIDGQSFSIKDKLVAMVDKARAKMRKQGHHAGGAVAAHHEREAERIIRVMAARLDLPSRSAELAKLRKGHPDKSHPKWHRHPDRAGSSRPC